MDELDEGLYEKYGIELNMTTREKENFIKDVLRDYWYSIHAVTFQNRSELYWSRLKDGKRRLVLAFLVDAENLNIRRKFIKNYERKRKLEGDNDSSDSKE